jgi:hypothetical protein
MTFREQEEDDFALSFDESRVGKAPPEECQLNPWLSGANEKRIARNSLRPPQIAILGNETLSDPTRNVDLEG